MMKRRIVLMAAALLCGVTSVWAEEIGSVDTVFKLLGPDHKIIVEAFDDPDVTNVTCYLSRAKTAASRGGLAWRRIRRMPPFPVSRWGRLL